MFGPGPSRPTRALPVDGDHCRVQRPLPPGIQQSSVEAGASAPHRLEALAAAVVVHHRGHRHRVVHHAHAGGEVANPLDALVEPSTGSSTATGPSPAPRPLSSLSTRRPPSRSTAVAASSAARSKPY